MKHPLIGNKEIRKTFEKMLRVWLVCFERYAIVGHYTIQMLEQMGKAEV